MLSIGSRACCARPAVEIARLLEVLGNTLADLVGVRQVGHRVTLQVYPGIDHAFDHRTLPASSRLRYEADATADSVKRVHAFLGAV